MSRRGRPAGATRRAVLQRLHCGVATMRDLTAELGLTLRQADWLLRDLRATRQVAVVGATRLPGAKRPVAVYGHPPVLLAANWFGACPPR